MGLIPLFKKRDMQPELHLQLLVVFNNWGAVQLRAFVHKKQRHEEKRSRDFLAPDPE
jgi:hypothetical protein